VKFTSTFIFLFSFSSLFGQKTKAFIDSLRKKELNFIPVPSLTIGPEVGVMYGIFIDYYYNAGGKKDSTTRPSLSFVDVQYSTKKQMNFEIFSSVYTKQEKYYFFIRAGYYDDFEQYWGETYPVLGKDEYISTRYKRYQAFGRLTKNLGNQHFLGVGYQYNKYFNFEFGETTFPAFIPQKPASNILGAGLVYTIDKRNSQFSPTEGHYVDFSAYKMFDLTKATRGYYQYNLDIRKYFEHRRHVLANQFVVGATSGEVPPFEKLRIGGPTVLRGLFKGQFRDNNLWVLQTEYRYELIPFIKVAYFASVGNTAPTLNSLFQQKILFGHGVGLRFRVNKGKEIYARLDYAITSHNTQGFYIRLGDAF
jgi:hypothetical protein